MLKSSRASLTVTEVRNRKVTESGLVEEHKIEHVAAFTKSKTNLPRFILTSAGTLCFINRRLIGSLKSVNRSAGFNRSQLIGSAEQAQI